MVCVRECIGRDVCLIRVRLGFPESVSLKHACIHVCLVILTHVHTYTRRLVFACIIYASSMSSTIHFSKHKKKTRAKEVRYCITIYFYITVIYFILCTSFFVRDVHSVTALLYLHIAVLYLHLHCITVLRIFFAWNYSITVSLNVWVSQ